MSRFTDDLRERSRRAGHVATGYRMAGARDLALAADTVSHHCRNAADAIEALERAEKLARDAEPVDLASMAVRNGGFVVLSARLDP